jgi:hypothetical protein
VTVSEPGGPASPDSTVDPFRPASLLWAVRLLGAEAAGLAVVTAYLIYQDLTATATSLGVAIALTVLAALGALGTAAVARSLARRSAAARGPAVVVQLMLLLVSPYMLQAGQFWLAVPLIVMSVGAGALLLAPPTTKAIGLGPKSE